MDEILTAILNDDRPRIRKLLRAHPGLATRLIDTARLYESKIFHWIYVGDTALHLAAAGHRVELVRLLLAAGADPNSRTNHRQSGPLHYAADGYINGPDWDAKRQVKTIQCLLDAGAEIDAQDKNGAAPLHRAVRTRCAAAVKCLLRAGSDATLRNKSGSTPFHLGRSGHWPRWNWRGSSKNRTAADHPPVSFFWPDPCTQGQQRQIRLQFRQEYLDTKYAC